MGGWCGGSVGVRGGGGGWGVDVVVWCSLVSVCGGGVGVGDGGVLVA